MVLVSRVLGTVKVNYWDSLKNALVQGNISSSTGQEGSSTTRLRTNGYISVEPNTIYSINAIGAATQCFIFEYSDNYQYEKYYSGWKPLGLEYTTNWSTKYIRIVFAKADNGTITAEEVTSVSVVKVKKSINYIEYLQSNGTQYIDTGVKGKSTGSTGTKVILDLSVSAHNGCGLFGARAATGGSKAFNIFNYTDKIRADFYQTIGEQRDRPTDTRFKITMDNNKLQIAYGSSTGQQIFSQGTFTTPVNLYLFTVNTNGTAYNPGATAKLYGCQIYDETGALVRDFKPAKDDSNVDCLYDVVTKQYFYMQTITSTGA